MKKYLFAVASVTSLAGFVGAMTATGCSSPDPSPVAPADGGADVVKPPTTRPPTDGSDTTDPPPQTCMTDKEVDFSSVAYKSPTVAAGSCDTSDLDIITALAKSNPNATFSDVQTALASHNAACASCVFAKDGDKWAPLVTDGTTVIAVNLGGCVELASGKAECGKAYQQWNACLDEACKSCSDSEANDCSQGAQAAGAPCEKATAALETACGTDANTYIDKCFKQGDLTIMGPIKAQCIGGTIKDASTD